MWTLGEPGAQSASADFWMALLERPSPLPAIGPVPQCQGVEAGLCVLLPLTVLLMHCRNCM